MRHAFLLSVILLTLINGTYIEVKAQDPVTVTISNVPDDTQREEFPITITFSENVTGFDATEIELGGGVTATVVLRERSGTVYIAVITPTSSGDLTIKVPANVVEGGNQASNTVTVTIDLPPTVVTFTPSGNAAKNIVVNEFEVRILFNESVTGLEANDIELTVLTGTVSNPVGTSTQYTVLITPDADQEGSITIQLKAGAVQDTGGNNNKASAEIMVTVDTVAPTVEDITGIPTTATKDDFDITITFSENVIGFRATDLTIAGVVETETPAMATLPSENDGSEEYTVTIAPEPDFHDDVTITVKAGAVEDTATNGNAAFKSATFIIDTRPPKVTSITKPTTPQNTDFEITVLFSEPVNNFDATDLTIAGVVKTGTPAMAMLTTGAKGDTEYIFDITPNSDFQDDVTITVNQSDITDTVGNPMTTSMDAIATVRIDNVDPEVTVIRIPMTAENEPEPQNTAFNITVVFSESVTSFDATDLTITAPTEIQDTVTATPLSGATETEYTFNISPISGVQIPIFEGDITIIVNENAAEDTAGNSSIASDPATVHFDTILPEVQGITGIPTMTTKDPFDITITFTEKVTGFDLTHIVINQGADASPPSGTDGMNYTVNIQPHSDYEGPVTITVRPSTNVVTDLAGNSYITDSASATAQIDTLPPKVQDITGIPTTDTKDDFDITITFTEEVTGFQAAHLTIEGPATATLKSEAPGGKVYTLTITPKTDSEDDVIMIIHKDLFTDLPGNFNAASSRTAPFHVDTIAPKVAIGALTMEQNEAFDITITFDEEVTEFQAADLKIDVETQVPAAGVGAATATLKSEVLGGEIYMVTITPTPIFEGDVTITVNPDTVKDTARNGNIISNPVTFHFDNFVPTVEITDIPDTVQLEAFSLTILFSEDVNEFLLEDISFSGDAVIDTSTLEGTGSTYTLTITPHEDTDGDVILQVPADVADDQATNPNTASFSETIAVAPIWIPDPNLRAVIRDGLGLGLGDDFARTDLEDLTILNGPSRQIDGLTGLENAINLTQLNLNGNFIRELNPLSDLTKLTSLKLNDNSITAIDALRNLVKLTILELSGNRIGTLPALTDLINLKTLDLSENRIKNISPIAGLTALTNLNLTTNQISDVSPVANLKNLLVLRISENTITDTDILVGLARIVELDGTLPSLVADPALRNVIRTHLSLTEAEQITIVDMENLTALELESIGITSLAGLEYAIALTTLNLSDNSITDITLLQGLSQLITLTLNDNSITDITPLQNLTSLTTLGLGGNRIADITPLQELDALTTLTLSNNPITDFAPLAELTSVTALELSRNSITDLNVISQLPQLLTLDISDNSITNITPLQNLTALTTLNLRGNTVSNLNPILQLTDLTNLDLSSTSVQDLRPLAGLTQLTTLHLNGNTLSDVTPLATLTNLTTLSLAENTITRLNAITTLTQLTTLTLEANSITDVTPLASLPQLTALDLRDNTIGDVTPLAGFLNLRTLHLMGNPILDTTPLYPLTQRIPPVDIDIVVSQYPSWDVNQDGNVDAVDSALVTAALGQNGEAIANPRTDVNGDGTVDNADLLLVTENFDNNDAGAPILANILTPEKTRLLANYPNPFNPETWIPYHLAHPSNVVLTIYDTRGAVIRRLELGHQGAGYYIKKHRAAYWDGRNSVGEPVANGVYFYQLQTDNTAMLQKMVILK